MLKEFTIETNGEGFYNLTEKIQAIVRTSTTQEGTILIFTPHTSCALSICEAHDPAALTDVENFLKHLAPRNLAFITHKEEGPDDSPSHMKSILLHPSLQLIISEGKLLLGVYQGIFLTEFRDGPKERKLYLKFC